MFGNKMSATKLNFRIKLLSGNNVVLVESCGYETELFMPQILNGRITFQNIIPNRRCCYAASAIGSKLSSCDQRTPPHNKSNSKAWRMSAGQDLKHTIPIAYSTPVQSMQHATVQHSSKHHLSMQHNSPMQQHSPRQQHSPMQQSTVHYSQSNKENNPQNRFNRVDDDPCSQSSSILQSTPEQGRCTVPSPYEVVKDTLVQIPSGIKVIRLYRSPSISNPKRMSRISAGNNNTAHSSTTTPYNEISGFRLPSSPDMHRRYLSEKNCSITHPTESSLQKQVSKSSYPSKWQKCITPLRTYSRRSTALLQNQNSGSNIKKSPRFTKILPTYLINPTQGPKGTHKLEVRKRKLIVDSKVHISPRTFKKQHKEPIDLKKNQSVKCKLLKNRKSVEKSKESAFDMLTNSNRARCISAKLTSQFRKSCINKGASTYSKYKQLSTIAPVEAIHQQHKEKSSATGGKRRKLSLTDVAAAIAQHNLGSIASYKSVRINECHRSPTKSLSHSMRN